MRIPTCPQPRVPVSHLWSSSHHILRPLRYGEGTLSYISENKNVTSMARNTFLVKEID